MKPYLIVLLCCTASLCWGQERKKFSFGPTVGGGVAGWYETTHRLELQNPISERVRGTRFIPSYAVGAFGKYYLNPNVSISVKLLYVRGGSQQVYHYRGIHFVTGEPFVTRDEQTLRMNLLRAPVALSWDITRTNVRPFVKAGASSNRLLGGGYRNDYYHRTSDGETRDKTEPLRLNSRSNRSLRYDWSFYTGIGLNVQQRFLVEIDTFLGPLRSYYFAEGGCPVNIYCVGSEGSYHNRAILMTLSYGF